MPQRDTFVTQEQYDKSLTSDDYVKFSQTFNAEETQRLIGHSINKLILQAMTCDHDTRNETKKIIKECEKEEFWLAIKKFGSIITYILAVFGGSLLTLLIQYLTK